MNTTQLSTLNQEQIDAITFGDGPLMIIAGAGTGKTTVITERICHLIGTKKVPPQQILALTFTEKASREMEERIDKALPYGMTQMWISTFHAFCDRVLRADGIQIGLNPSYRLMTDADTIQFFRSHIFEFSLSYFRPLGNPTKFIEGMIQHFSRLKDEDVSPIQYADWITKQHPSDEAEKEELKKYIELSEAYALYEELKKKEGRMDYSDLISHTVALFRTRPNVLKKYRDQFTYILIDEFQDTNYAQNQLAMLLAGKTQNITVVGDDDQSVYKWRGAALSNMLSFKKHFPKTQMIVLTKNYRSTKEILDRSYDLIQQNNPDRLEVTEHVDKKLESMRRINGSPVRFLFADRVEDEAEAAAKQILACIKEKPELEWKDVAILVRANNHALPFSRALERMGIPYQFLGPGQLFRQPEVKDLIAYMNILAAIDDTVSFYRLLTMEWLDLDIRDVSTIVSYARRQGVRIYDALYDVLSQKDNNEKQGNIRIYNETTYEKINRLVTMIEKHLKLIRKESAGQILYYFLEETGLLAQFVQYKTERQEQIAQNIASFFDRLKTYEAEHEDASIYTVVDWISLSLELGESPMANNTDWHTQNAVHIMTVHSSKGLEFPVVFIANAVAARFPSIERKDQIPIPESLIKDILPSGDYHIQEERRLFYVAMTRAKDSLFITAAKYYGDGKREKKISPFIAEAIGVEAVDVSVASPIGETKQLSLLDFAPQENHNTLTTPQTDGKNSKTSSYVSYSQIDTFLTCPLQYKYKYVLRLPVPPSAALSFGNTIHNTLEQFYKLVQEQASPSVDDLLHIYNTLWKSVGYGHKGYETKMKQHGEFLLKEFYEKGYTPGRIPKQLEAAFKLKLTPALSINGKVDRVDVLDDGKIEIIDYKTGQSTRLKKEVKNDLQLSVYAMAATDQGVYAYRPEDVIVSFYFLEIQEKISGTRTKEQLEAARQKIIDTAQKIAASDFKPTPGKQCDFCEFRLLCEAWT